MGGLELFIQLLSNLLWIIVSAFSGQFENIVQASNNMVTLVTQNPLL